MAVLPELPKSDIKSHIREQDSRECRACGYGSIWPCETAQRELAASNIELTKETKLAFKAGQTYLGMDGYRDPFEDWTEEEIAEAYQLIEKKREQKRRAQAKLERQQRRNEAHKNLLCGLTWQTADGRVLAVREMTPNHALNTLRMLESGRHPAGRWAIEQAWEVEGAVAPGHTETSYMRFGTWPLTEALWKRSQESPTLRERFADFKSARAYQKRQP